MNKKRHLLFLGALILVAAAGVPKAWAQDTPQLLDLWFNQNGTFTEDTGTGVAGVDETALNESTGLGTITFTDTTAGAGYFNTFINEAVGVPYYDEFGSTSGTTSSGESYEIGSVPYVTAEGGYDDTQSSTFTDAQNGTLGDTNGLPSGSSNYYDNCLSSGCNGDVAVALGDSFTVASGDEEIITVTVSQTAPTSGFYIEQTNPSEDNPNSGVVGNVYYSLSAEQVPMNSGSTGVPEPDSWVLMLIGLIGLLLAGWRMRHPSTLRMSDKFAVLVAVVAVALSGSAKAQEVLTVPWDPTNPAAPHTAYQGATIVLGATFVGGVSGHSYTYSWNYGDGSAATAAASVTVPNDIHGTHAYPSGGSTAGITSWTAVVTVTDTSVTPNLQYTGDYLVIWENNTLQSRVNVAIDWGLWYLHQNMYHPTATTGTWARNCAPGYAGYACGNGYGGLDANNAQAFEVNGHLATGPATDPYTSDVAEALADMLVFLNQQSVQPKTYNFNPATANFGCSDGTAPTTTNHGSPSFYCDTSATPVYYNSTSTSCGTPPCTFTFDGNSNGEAVFVNGESWYYEPGMFADALVASGQPTLTAASLPAPYTGYGNYTGSIGTESFKDVVQDIVDAAAYCQYGYDYDVSQGYTRGDEAYQGGGWWYDCQEGDDNSVSQWATIGLIAANRGFGISIPTIVTDANNLWVTASQDVQSTDVQGTNSGSAGNVDDPAQSGYGNNSYDYGAFGYNGSFYYSDAWGPWAVTPSGMVQMSMDGIGRTNNTAFGNASNAPDQRWNAAETYYADNFCNPLTGGYANAYYTPRLYTYGMFSFTKSMLLHNPGGTLAPIQYLRTQTPGVFTTNGSVPANTIDWYAALSPANGGTDPCDGVAQTLLDRQTAAGYWYGSNVSGAQYPFETAWSLIMLQKSVFVACVNNLQGAGTKLRTGGGRIDLTWTGIPTASGYEVLRSTQNGGPYTEISSTTNQSYSDTSGLVIGDTYYYVLQPTNGSGTALCQSNQATVVVP